MPAGTHTVTVYPDRTAGEWSPPLASNPYLTNNAAGWIGTPFSPGWTWSNGQMVGGASVARDGAYPVLRPAGATQWRTRYRFTINSGTGVIFYGLTFGKTAHDAWGGPFWSPGQAEELWAAQELGPGTHTVEQTWNSPTWPPPEFGYLSPRISFAESQVGNVAVDSIELSYIGAAGVDMSCLVDRVSIIHGRDDPTAQPEASGATIDLSPDPDGRFSLPPEVEIGAVIKVTTVTGNSESIRFAGRVTDLTLGWEEAREDTPDNGVGQLICTGILDDPARRVVGDAPWPVEKDGTRVARIMTAAGVNLDPLLSDPGTVNILARDVDAQAALDLARDVASSAGGMVWQTKGGEIRYADADHRRGLTPTLSLDACNIRVTPTWRRTLDGLINSVSIGYGVAPEGGEQPRVTGSDPASMTKYGTYGASIATQLAAVADAQAMASLLMVRNSSPVWVMAALPVDVLGLTADEYAGLLALDVHSLVNLSGLPTIGAAPTSAVLWVEGWTEVLTAGGHDIELAVSGYCRTSPPPRWDDLNPSWTWNTIPAEVTWDSVTCLGPPVNYGRWNDVPATLRWDQVPPTTTWDTWVIPTAT